MKKWVRNTRDGGPKTHPKNPKPREKSRWWDEGCIDVRDMLQSQHFHGPLILGLNYAWLGSGASASNQEGTRERDKRQK